MILSLQPAGHPVKEHLWDHPPCGIQVMFVQALLQHTVVWQMLNFTVISIEIFNCFGTEEKGVDLRPFSDTFDINSGKWDIPSVQVEFLDFFSVRDVVHSRQSNTTQDFVQEKHRLPPDILEKDWCNTTQFKAANRSLKDGIPVVGAWLPCSYGSYISIGVSQKTPNRCPWTACINGFQCKIVRSIHYGNR